MVPLGLGEQQMLRLTGKAFLESDPFGSGVARVVTREPREGPNRPSRWPDLAEGIYILLTVDGTGRIVRERLAAPNPLVSRTFDYPGPRQPD